METKISVIKGSSELKNSENFLFDTIINDTETQIRVGIKAVEERVFEEAKLRRMNAPLTTEERALFSL